MRLALYIYNRVNKRVYVFSLVRAQFIYIHEHELVYVDVKIYKFVYIYA